LKWTIRKFPKRGSFGEVYEVRLIWRSDTRTVRKRIFRYDEEVSKRVEKEVEIFAKFSHPHAIPLLRSYTHRMELHLLLQLAERNFTDFLLELSQWFRSTNTKTRQTPS
jgi:serine/threonine protein kinase